MDFLLRSDDHVNVEGMADTGEPFDYAAAACPALDNYELYIISEEDEHCLEDDISEDGILQFSLSPQDILREKEDGGRKGTLKKR
eukprot:11154736-Ditylum_brightwellii.AAC.1